MAIVKETGTFKSTSKEPVNIFYAIWRDDSVKPVGVLQMEHGINEYIERYEPLAEFLAKQGYIVCGDDHLGHGKTSTLAHIAVFPKDTQKAIVSDMYELYKIMHKKYSNLPYFLYGHSLGSLIVRTYLTKHSKDLKAAIICGTGYFPSVLSVLNPVLGILSRLLRVDYDKMMQKDMTPPNKTTPPKSEMLQLFWLSYDKPNIEEYVLNPYDGAPANKSILNLAGCLLDGGKPGWIRRISKKLPMYIISGDADPVGLWGRGPKIIYREMKAAGRNVELKIYPHTRHEIHNEPTVKDEVYNDILTFLNKNL